jgi:DNA-binding response OmpR family regulator
LNGDLRVTERRRVLIVDASPESREVLRTLLELRGAATLEADRPDEAVRLADLFRPNLILLDAECDRSLSGEPMRALHEAASRSHTPIVILGKLRKPHGPMETGQFVTKPYHYGPLIRKIESMLAAA